MKGVHVAGIVAAGAATFAAITYFRRREGGGAVCAIDGACKRVSVVKVDPQGNAKVHLRVGDAFAEVYSFGAHVTQFYTKSPKSPILFLSENAILDKTKPIRGGIPIIWPQFGPTGPLPQHGFARNNVWSVTKETVDEAHGTAEVTFGLEANAETRKAWPHDFRLSYTVRLTADDLKCTWEVENPKSASAPFSFTSALHSYFNVADIARTVVTDLSKLQFLDSTKNHEKFKSDLSELKINGEIDRVYLSTPNKLTIRDTDGDIIIEKDGQLPDAVIWNPGSVKAQAMKDFKAAEYNTMLCVEPAAIKDTVQLAPGAKWTTTLSIRKNYHNSKL